MRSESACPAGPPSRPKVPMRQDGPGPGGVQSCSLRTRCNTRRCDIPPWNYTPNQVFLLIAHVFSDNGVEYSLLRGVAVPRADTDVRASRDAWVMRQFLAGQSYREIGKHPKVKLSAKGVGNVVNRHLAEANPRHNPIAQQGAQVYIERLEMLLRVAWPQALRGDLRAVMVCLRVLKQEARFHGLDGDAQDTDARDGLDAADGVAGKQSPRRRMETSRVVRVNDEPAQERYA